MKLIYSNINRFEIAKQLEGSLNIGVELGVAEGNFSYQMMKLNKFKNFYGVDAYQDFQHNNIEYKKTKNKLSIFKNYKLIRKRFEQTLDEFEDESIDFLYIDGFAHEGNDGGRTFFNWIRKVKVGGICSGDDYHDDWPLVKKTVNYYMNKINQDLYITNTYNEDKYSDYPSWYFRKQKKINIQTPQIFIKEGKYKHERELFKRSFYGKIINFNIKYIFYKILQKILPTNFFFILLNFYKKLFNK